MIKYSFYKLKFAICSLIIPCRAKTGYPHSNGKILFTEYPSHIEIQFQLKNWLSGSYDLYIHEYGDESFIYDSLGLQYRKHPLAKIIITTDGVYNNIINIRNLHIDEIMGRSIIMYCNTKKIAYGIIGYREK